MNKITSLNQTKPRGFSLIEVMVALLVLSIGLLGLAALQTTSLQYNTDSYTRTQATLLAYDIVDRMRANSIGLNAGNYDVATDATAATAKAATAACGTSSCIPSDVAKYDLGQWYARMELLLPESTVTGKLATLVRDSTPASATFNTVTITIKWKEHDLGKQLQWVVQL
jgi:type IV pilus assembly protein PilV